MESYKIYKITNNVNGKIYIGGTNNSLETRWSRHLFKYKQGYQYPLYKAIAEYGEDNFSKSVIEECSSLEEMNERERYWIAKLSSTNPEIGYNVRAGGGIRRQSDITKKKIGQIHKGKVSEKRIPVLVYDLNGDFIREFESIESASKTLEISNVAILNSIKKRLKHPTRKTKYIFVSKEVGKEIEVKIDPKDHFSDIEYKPQLSDKFISKREEYQNINGDFASQSVAVAQYNVNTGELVAKYRSLAEAYKKTGVSPSTIKLYLNNPDRISKRSIYTWRKCDSNDPDITFTQEDVIKEVANKRARVYRAFDPNTGELVKEYRTVREFEKGEHSDRRTIEPYLNTELLWKGYYWETNSII